MALVTRVEVEGLTQIPTAYQAVSEGVKRRMSGVHREAIKRMNSAAEQNFRDSIIRPDTSSTISNVRYRPRVRATGRFSFGTHSTFRGKLIDEKTVQGFGYPDMERADQRTDFAWRALEFGLDSIKMPDYLWKNAVGVRVGSDQRSPGGDYFTPKRGSAARPTSSRIKEKRFIRDAFDNTVVPYMNEAYVRILDQALREATK